MGFSHWIDAVFSNLLFEHHRVTISSHYISKTRFIEQEGRYNWFKLLSVVYYVLVHVCHSDIYNCLAPSIDDKSFDTITITTAATMQNGK